MVGEWLECVCTLVNQLSPTQVLDENLAYTVCTETQCFETMEDLEGGVIYQQTAAGGAVLAVAFVVMTLLAVVFPPPVAVSTKHVNGTVPPRGPSDSSDDTSPSM